MHKRYNKIAPFTNSIHQKTLAGIYIHIPFCKQKCHYCDFHFSVSLRSKSDLLEALKNELILRKDECNEPIETIYFGGGTPSILSEKELAQIFEVIYQNYTISEHPEITLEANPDDLTLLQLKNLYSLKVNRLSIGIQSFHDDELLLMNRVHTAEEANNCVKDAQNVGFENISIDLIYGFPNSNVPKWQKNLDTFLDLQIPHLSSYALTVEKKTALDHMIKTGIILPLDEDLAENQFHTLRNFMKENGFIQYELSNFGKPDYFSKHNTSYWQGKPYIGIGPSAHSFSGTQRSWNISNNAKYINFLNKGKLALETENLTVKDRYNEYIMTRLRTIWGVDLDKINADFGIEFFNYFTDKSSKYLKNNTLYKINDNGIGVKPESYFLIDGIIADLFYL